LYFVYLDAAGDVGSPSKKGSSKYFVLAAIAIKDSLWLQAYNGVTGIISKYFPNPATRPPELHYHEIRTQRPPYNTVNTYALVDEVFDLISNLDHTLFAMVVDKLAHHSKYVTPWPFREHMLEAMTNRVQLFLQRKNDLGLYVYDKEEQTINDELQKILAKFRSGGTNFRFPAHVVESIFFAPAESAVPLQLVDFWAYAVFSKFEHSGKDKRFLQVRHKLDTVSGQVYGLRKFP